MWELVNNSSILDGISIGQIITTTPDDPVDQYEVKMIGAGYVKAVHCNGRAKIKIFPEEELILGKWWVKG